MGKKGVELKLTVEKVSRKEQGETGQTKEQESRSRGSPKKSRGGGYPHR